VPRGGMSFAHKCVFMRRYAPFSAKWLPKFYPYRSLTCMGTEARTKSGAQLSCAFGRPIAAPARVGQC
jgi:hypothetical protein